MAGTLSQYQDGIERPAAFPSRQLNQNEQGTVLVRQSVWR